MEPAPLICPVCGTTALPGAQVCAKDGAVLDDGTGSTQIRDPLIGRQMGEYVTRRRVGVGGMGVVYEAVHPIIGKRAAIKILRPELAEDPEQMKRLLDEARAVASIRHRSVIDIFGFGELGDGRHYMVMEFLDGEPLDFYLDREGARPVLEVCALLDEILGGLSAAHAVGVIHRDLKPSNVILLPQPDGSKELKVLDFGLAKRASKPHDTTPQTNVARVLGTPEYMAPEQAQGQDVGPRTDLYALGIMAFEMVTGKRPFDAPSPVEIMIMQMNEPPPVPSSLVPGVPAALDALILQLLAKSPTERPASAEEVRQALTRIRNPVTTAKNRPPRTRSGEGPARRSKPAHQKVTPQPAPKSDDPDTLRPGAVVMKPTEQLPDPAGVDATFKELDPVRPPGTLGDAALGTEAGTGRPHGRSLALPDTEDTAPSGQALPDPAGETTLRRGGSSSSTSDTQASPGVVPAAARDSGPLPQLRSRWPLGIAAGVIVAAAVGLAWALWPESAKRPQAGDALPDRTTTLLPVVEKPPPVVEKPPPVVEKPPPVVERPPPVVEKPEPVVVKPGLTKPRPNTKRAPSLESLLARIDKLAQTPQFSSGPQRALLARRRKSLEADGSDRARAAAARALAKWESQLPGPR